MNFEFRSKDANVSSLSGVSVFTSGGEVYLWKACANPPRFFSSFLSAFTGIVSKSSSPSLTEKSLLKWNASQDTVSLNLLEHTLLQITRLSSMLQY